MEPRPEFFVIACLAIFFAMTACQSFAQTPTAPAKKQFRVWAFSDAHVGSDLKQRESLADALKQSEGANGFEWDIALNLGDNSGAQGLPSDHEGQEVVKQLSVLTKHRREQIYDLSGNHDRGAPKDPDGEWFQKWLDPMGKNTKFSKVENGKRPFVVEGTWERYSFRAGNLLFLMMSDVNEPTQKIGRGELGGNPGGVVRGETFEWWKKTVQENPEAIIVSAHHYMLKDTTTASGAWEGMIKTADGKWKSGYHGYKEKGTPEGASYIYWVNSEPNAQAFEKILAGKANVDAPAGSGLIALWLGGHTHPKNPDDMHGGKSLIATKWGVNFANISALTAHHHNAGFEATPMSRLFTFTDGSDEVRVQCYLHTTDYAPIGWYAKAERTLKLPRAFKAP